MILIDTSVWINHFNKSNAELVAQLNVGFIACHPFIIGELACGNIANRRKVLNLLHVLPSTPVVTSAEILDFIETRKLMNKGLGYVDIHLLASTVLASVAIWTTDRRLREAAVSLGISYHKS